MFFHICRVFVRESAWEKILFFLGLVFEIHFRVRMFVFCCLGAL